MTIHCRRVAPEIGGEPGHFLLVHFRFQPQRFASKFAPDQLLDEEEVEPEERRQFDEDREEIVTRRWLGAGLAGRGRGVRQMNKLKNEQIGCDDIRPWNYVALFILQLEYE